MGLTHIRLPKNFNLDERLERYADAIETHAPALAGRWAQDCWPLGVCRADGGAAYSAVHLDLGCGKGSFIAQCAAKQPDVLYIGMDVEPICIAYAAQRAIEDGLRNMVLVPRGADALPQLFAAGELAGITLNFPTPYPKRHHARRRLVNVDHLLGFRQLLARSRCEPTASRSGNTRRHSSRPRAMSSFGFPPTRAPSTPSSPKRSTSAA